MIEGHSMLKTLGRLVLYLAGLILFLGAQDTQAGFQNAAAGVRPAGMGEAFTAVADDANAVLYNPAGLARVSGFELTGMYADLYSQLNAKIYTGQADKLGYGFIAVVLPPLGTIGNLGFGWNQFYSALYSENTYTVSFAKMLLPDHRFTVGISGKILEWHVAENEFSMDTAMFPARQKSGFTADLGFISMLSPDLTLGAAVENIMPVDLSLDSTEQVPLFYHLGIAYAVSEVLGFSDRLLISADVTARSGVLNSDFGAEAWFLNQVLALRAGGNLDGLSAGLSLRYATGQQIWQLDYAFVYPFQIVSSLGSHRVGITVAWNQPPADKIVPPVSEPVTPQKITEELENQKSLLEEGLNQISRDIEIGTLNPILFETAKSTLLPSAFSTLDNLGEMLEHYPELVVRIEGHTDEVGSDEYNMVLSQQRAEAVGTYLSGKYTKIKPGNLILIGYGKTRRVTTNTDDASRARNRRVEFKVINSDSNK
jgi:outer membrane protein OmpA-like peptidoglycan-associated protein